MVISYEIKYSLMLYQYIENHISLTVPVFEQEQKAWLIKGAVKTYNGRTYISSQNTRVEYYQHQLHHRLNSQ